MMIFNCGVLAIASALALVTPSIPLQAVMALMLLGSALALNVGHLGAFWTLIVISSGLGLVFGGFNHG